MSVHNQIRKSIQAQSRHNILRYQRKLQSRSSASSSQEDQDAVSLFLQARAGGLIDSSTADPTRNNAFQMPSTDTASIFQPIASLVHAPAADVPAKLDGAAMHTCQQRKKNTQIDSIQFLTHDLLYR